MAMATPIEGTRLMPEHLLDAIEYKTMSVIIPVYQRTGHGG